MKVDIATFGSATKDLFMRVDGNVVSVDDFVTKKGICFPLGSKVRVDEIVFTTGGGGTNSAATFSAQGFETAFIGRVGDDWAGRDVVEELTDLGVNVDYVKKERGKKTNFSVVLDLEGQDRTILVYRGASSEINKDDFPEDLESEWYYLAPFAEDSLDVFYSIIKRCRGKIAINPSKPQLKDAGFLDAIEDIDILVVNQEEAAILTGIPYDREDEIFNKIDEMYEGVFIMTKGAKGLTVSDNETIYKAKAPDSYVADRTGAGDSFSSGFVSEFMRSGDVEESIQLGIANATACLKERGAKNGLLKKGEFYQKVEIQKRKK